MLFFREVPGWGYAEKKECLSFAVSRAAQTVAHVKKSKKIRRKFVVCVKTRNEEKMGEESVDGAKLGTKLIMFVAIIGLALAAFLMGKSLVNTGVDQMETSVKSINDSQFSDYDAKIVRGRAVKSALSTFGNAEYAIVICTQAMADGGKGTTEGCIQSGAAGHAIPIEGNSMEKKSGTKYGTVYGINYNAQLGKNSGDTSSVIEKITIKNGLVKLESGEDFYTEDGNIKYYMDTSRLTKKGQVEYIADTSSFYANLIKNDSNDILGIVFTQRRIY